MMLRSPRLPASNRLHGGQMAYVTRALGRVFKLDYGLDDI